MKRLDVFSGKKTTYQKMNGYHGICYIYDWCDAKAKYERRQNGEKYYAYKKINGHQRSKCFSTFEMARKWRESNVFFEDAVDSQDLLFHEVKQRFFEHKQTRVRPSTLETYQANTKHLAFFDSLPMSQINAKAIDVWLEKVKKPDYLVMQHKSRMTYEHELKALRQILVFYSEYICDSYHLPIKKRHRDDSIVDRNKYRESKANNKTRFIPVDDCNKFMAEFKQKCSKNESYWLYYLLANFQLRTGARIGEVCALDYRDIDFESGEVSISKTVFWSRRGLHEISVTPMTKTGERRSGFAPLDLLNLLKQWMQMSGRSKGLIFSECGFRPVSYRSIQYHFNTVFGSAGLPWTSTHILRHTYATQFLEMTQNPHALKSLLGHSKMEQTEHYAKTTANLIQIGFRDYERGTKDVLKIEPIDGTGWDRLGTNKKGNSA